MDSTPQTLLQSQCFHMATLLIYPTDLWCLLFHHYTGERFNEIVGSPEKKKKNFLGAFCKYVCHQRIMFEKEKQLFSLWTSDITLSIHCVT